MSSNQLLIDFARNLIKGKMTSLLRNSRMENDLQKNITQLLQHVLHVVPVDCFEKLSRFLDQAAGQRLMGLLAIPRTSVGSTQAHHRLHQILNRTHSGGLSSQTPKLMPAKTHSQP